jgi:hypothetical protein
MLVLVFHCYFNVWRRLQSGWKAFQMRRKAAANMQTLAKASATQLHQLADVCAICFNVSYPTMLFDVDTCVFQGYGR